MSCIKLAACAAALGLGCLAGASTALAVHLDYYNRIADPSFEGTLTFDGAPFVGTWEGFSGDPVASSEFTSNMPRTGAQSLELNIDQTANSFAGAFQDAVLDAGSAGKTAYFSGWHKATGEAASEIRVEWRDSVAGVEVSRTPNLSPMLSTDFEEFIVSAEIPAGADSARLVYAIQSFGGVLTQQVFVDDVNFNYAPEPVSAGLAALALLSVVARRGRD
ncbi:hypothetical protein Pla123a_01520 [Posidoniimonas polymericola]|uniref:PEP-CTERM protein-sorting domain-containing protein n=1 Tax=Posidoniimonas polymericola TaxID=2528002 RepID=A0A5C5ZDV5_9BACT|nr:hypothetical protein [Posidoniimonas polymericola]TWT85345.1 hypothetical protein Pla123a_01520 [Posidoniimonas polymericola]